MTKYKILSLLLSFVALVGSAFFVATGLDGLDRGTLTKTQEVLGAAAARLESTVNNAADGLTDEAAELADNKDLSTALSGLAKALKNAKPPEERPAPQQNRIDKAAEKLDEYREAFRATHGKTGVTFVDDEGLVLKTDSAFIKEGEGFKIPPLKAPPLEGEEESMLLEGEGSLVEFALAGHTLEGVTVADGRIYYVAAAPVQHPIQKKKIIGVALVDRQLTSLPPSPGMKALLMAGGETILGETPPGFSPPPEATEGAFLAIPADPPAEVPGLFSLPNLGLFGASHQPGTWAHAFGVPGAPKVRGYVYAEVTQIYSHIRGLQSLMLLIALVLWLLHAILIALDGRSVRKGVTQLADFLGQVTQGATEARNLPERKVPGPVRRLTRLVNQVLEHYVGGGSVPKLAASPTVDDVLGEAKVDGVEDESSAAPDFDGLEFQGIEGGGTLDVDKGDRDSPPPDQVGEASDGYDESIAELGDEVIEAEAEAEAAAELAAEEDLERAEEEAADKIDHIDDGLAAPTPPPPPADAIGAPDDDEGEPDLDDRTTEMMEMTPDVLDKLKKNVETKRGTAPLPPGLDEDLAELEAAADAKPKSKAPLPPPPGDDTAETAVMQVTPELIAQMKAVAQGEGDGSAASGAPTPPPPKPEPEPEPAAEDPEAARQAHFKEVYEAFVKTRKECGEKGELAFDKFAKRLEQSRAAVMQKHKCSDVRFQVYVKNGKAALKATPAK